MQCTDEQFEMMKKMLGLNQRNFPTRNFFIGQNDVLDDLADRGLVSKYVDGYAIKKTCYFLSEGAKKYTVERILSEAEEIHLEEGELNEQKQ